MTAIPSEVSEEIFSRGFPSDANPWTGRFRRIDGTECTPIRGRVPIGLLRELYHADLIDGEFRSETWLCEQLGPHGGKPRRPAALRRHIRYLQGFLEGTRFAIEGDRAAGYRLNVSPIATALPASVDGMATSKDAPPVNEREIAAAITLAFALLKFVKGLNRGS